MAEFPLSGVVTGEPACPHIGPVRHQLPSAEAMPECPICCEPTHALVSTPCGHGKRVSRRPFHPVHASRMFFPYFRCMQSTARPASRGGRRRATPVQCAARRWQCHRSDWPRQHRCNPNSHRHLAQQQQAAAARETMPIASTPRVSSGAIDSSRWSAGWTATAPASSRRAAGHTRACPSARWATCVKCCARTDARSPPLRARVTARSRSSTEGEAHGLSWRRPTTPAPSGPSRG